jgi:ribonuclease BN (tRNA processing enzyme)
MIPEIGFILDTGTGFFRARDLIETKHLDIFLSHAHLDHLQGVTYLLDVLWEKNIPKENVTIWGKADHLDYLDDHIFGSPGFPLSLPYRAISVTEKFTVRNVRVETKILPHPGKSVGYRFTFPDGRVLAYIMDTTTSGAQLSLMQDADLCIHECNFPDQLQGLPASTEEWARKTGHSTTSGVNELALKANVKRLAVIHFNPLDTREDPTDQANARVKFPGIIVTRDMMEIEF